MKKPRLSGISFYIVVVAVILLLSSLVNGSALTGRKPLPYSQILSVVSSGKVEEASVEGNTLKLKLKKDVSLKEVGLDETANRGGFFDILPKSKRQIELQKTVSPFWMEDLLTELKQASRTHDLKFDYQEPINFSSWFNGLLIIMMIASMGFFAYFAYMRQNGGEQGGFGFGRNKATRYDPTKNNITFKDVAGVEEERQELEEVVDFLKHPQRYQAVGAKIPHGILLVGPPGTGKTLLAKAVAGEANVPFFSISGSNFVEMFVGVGASRVRDLFDEAKKKAPAIVFIDEIDGVGRHRGAGMGGSHDEREQTLNQLLVEMDGFSPNEDVIVMAATNRPDILDPALLRPGRFDRRITVGRPTLDGREQILRVHARNKPLAPDVDLREVARSTPGFTGADLANLLNESALLCARDHRHTITYTDISESIFKVMLGPEKKSRVISEKEKRLTAYHEAGHALVLRSVSETDRVERVSIIAAGDAGGYTAHKPYEDRYYTTKSMLLSEIMVSLGGRAAEEILFGEVSTGAYGDLKHCNGIARDMICSYGMSDKLRNLVFGGGEEEVFLGRDYGHVKNYSDEVATLIDQEVQAIIDEAYAAVLALLRDKWAAVEALANRLLAVEKIEGDEFERLYQLHTTPEQRAKDAKNVSVEEVVARIHQTAQTQSADEPTDVTETPETI